MTQHSDIRIRPAIAKDIAACAICWGNRRNTYPSIYPLRLADPSITREERLERNARDLSNSLRDPHNVMHVACISQLGDPTTSKVVGYSIWARPEGLERDLRHWEDQKMKAFQYDKASNDDLDPECNHELAAELKEESMRVKKKLSQGKRMWFLQQLFILSDQQRRGIGTKLLEHGLELIKEEEASKQEESSTTQSEYEVALTSSPQGKVLYERYGFKDVYWFNPHFDDIDEQGNTVQKDVKWPLMLRQ